MMFSEEVTNTQQKTEKKLEKNIFMHLNELMVSQGYLYKINSLYNP